MKSEGTWGSRRDGTPVLRRTHVTVEKQGWTWHYFPESHVPWVSRIEDDFELEIWRIHGLYHWNIHEQESGRKTRFLALGVCEHFKQATNALDHLVAVYRKQDES